jgi:hypothetical protein
MTFDAQDNDFQYAKLDTEETKMKIEHTTDKWETAKTLSKKLSYIIGVVVILYIFWTLWNIYFVVGFFVSLPFTYFPARKLVKVPLRWFFQIDVKQPKFNIFGVPKSWSWSGDALPATDNADNAISIVRTIDTSGFHKVKTSMSTGDFDRLAFINDAKVLDRVVADKERLTAHLHYLKRNFWNAVIGTLMNMQDSSIAKPINELLRKSAIDLDLPTVGKRHETNTEQIGEDE